MERWDPENYGSSTPAIWCEACNGCVERFSGHDTRYTLGAYAPTAQRRRQPESIAELISRAQAQSDCKMTAKGKALHSGSHTQ
jgi:hypothetical protein